MPVPVGPVADQEPPTELTDFRLWCRRRGVKFDLVGDRDPLSEFAQRGEAFGVWCGEREGFACRHGWAGGDEARLHEEGLAEPFDLSAL